MNSALTTFKSNCRVRRSGRADARRRFDLLSDTRARGYYPPETRRAAIPTIAKPLHRASEKRPDNQVPLASRFSDERRNARARCLE